MRFKVGENQPQRRVSQPCDVSVPNSRAREEEKHPESANSSAEEATQETPEGWTTSSLLRNPGIHDRLGFKLPETNSKQSTPKKIYICHLRRKLPETTITVYAQRIRHLKRKLHLPTIDFSGAMLKILREHFQPSDPWWLLYKAYKPFGSIHPPKKSSNILAPHFIFLKS